MRTTHVYGYEAAPPTHEKERLVLATRRDQYKEQQDKQHLALNQYLGILGELLDLVNTVELPEDVKKVLLERRGKYYEKHEERLAILQNLEGRISELELLIQRSDDQRRGAAW